MAGAAGDAGLGAHARPALLRRQWRARPRSVWEASRWALPEDARRGPAQVSGQPGA